MASHRHLLVAESNGGVVVGLVDLGCLEDHLVDEGSGDAAQDGSKPVNLKRIKIINYSYHCH